MKQIYFIWTLTLCFAMSILYIPQLSADQKVVHVSDIIDMIAGDIQTVPVNNLTRVSVTNPDVADISDAQSDKITLLAKKAGTTAMFLWDDHGKRSIKIRVVNEDLKALSDRIQKLMNEANITGITMEANPDIGKLVLEGSLTKEDKNRLEDVLEPYSDNLLNLIKEEKSEDLIEVDMQVVEISTTLEKNLGILWGNSGNNGTNATPANGTTLSSLSSSSGTVQLGYQENMPTTGDSFKDLFRIGNFQRQTPLEATVNALVQEGKARLISKPRLVVVSGKQASFLVGGEIPIQNTTTSASGGSQTSSTTYSQYGVNMTVTPTIRKGKIDVLLNVDIRDVDNSSSFSTNSSIAFITRTATTELLMDNKQTIAMAGFIKYQDSVTLTEVPFLSKIPILGGLFRDRNEPADNSTEMVIILTPVVLTDKKIAQEQVVMPTPKENEIDDEFNKKYEHEPLPTWPAPSADTNPPIVTPIHSSPATVLADNDLQTVLPAMTAYARMIQEKISKAISYPPAALSKSLQGTVKLKLHILKDGTLDSEQVMRSSGSDILDQDALQAAKTAAPYDAFTMGMNQDDLILTVPIVFNKLMSGGKTPAEKVIAAY